LLFSRIFSPQWLLWLMPTLILVARTRWDIAGIIFYGVSTYLAFPMVWDYTGLSIESKIMGLVNTAVLAVIVILAIRRVHIQLSLKNFFILGSMIRKA
jgi:hypothetical protein